MRQQRDDAQRQAKKLAGDKQKLEATIRSLKQELGWQDELDPAHRATIRAFLDALHTTALLSAANRAVPTDGGRRTRTTIPGLPDAAPVYAHNRLIQELDHLDERTRALNTFNRTTPETRRARSICRACHRPLDHTWPRHCAWCGELLPGIDPPEESP